MLQRRRFIGVIYFCKTNAQIYCAAGSSVSKVCWVHHTVCTAAVAQGTSQPLLTKGFGWWTLHPCFRFGPGSKEQGNQCYQKHIQLSLQNICQNIFQQLSLKKISYRGRGNGLSGDGQEGRKEVSHQSVCHAVAMQACNAALPFRVTDRELCTEFARPQHHGLSRLLRPNSGWPTIFLIHQVPAPHLLGFC